MLSNIKLDLSRLNPNRHIIAVPDLHGSWQATTALVNLLSGFKLPVVFLGDYCDRGTSTVKTLDALVAAKKSHPEWVFLTGNHEQMLLDSFSEGISIIADKKFPSAYEEYVELGGIPEEHLLFLKSLKPYHESKSLLFIHGGISDSFDQPIDSVSLQELVWTYEISPQYAGKKIVRGHLLIAKPAEYSTHISLETGVGFGRHLSIGVLDDTADHIQNRLLGWFEMRPNGEFQAKTNIFG